MIDKPAAEVVSIGWQVRSPTLARACGGVPKNGCMVDHPELSWMPSGSQRPAWSVFHEAATADKIVDLPVGKADPDSEGGLAISQNSQEKWSGR